MENIYIQPGQWGEIFAIHDDRFNRDDCLKPVCNFRDYAHTQGYNIMQSHNINGLHNFKYLILFELPVRQFQYLNQYPKEKLILFLWEPPSIMSENYDLANHAPYSKVYTWHDDLVDNVKYFKLYYAVYNPMIKDIVDYENKHLCTMICGNGSSSHPNQLYGERRKVIAYFEAQNNDDFHFYGKSWPNNVYRTYKGPVHKKVDVLKNYRFSFCYENIKGERGYVTEKIFDCFRAGTVPIYWGAPNVSDYIPKNCFIAREDFSSLDELYFYIKNMQKDEYDGYIQNIQTFLDSDEAKKFSIEHFIETMMDLIKN